MCIRDSLTAVLATPLCWGLGSAWTLGQDLTRPAATGQPVTIAKQHLIAELTADGADVNYGGIYRTVFTADGRNIATRDRDQVVRMYDCPSGKLLFESRLHHSPVNIAFSPDGSRLVSATMNERTQIVDSATGKKIHELSPWAKCIGFTDAGDLLLVDDKVVHRFDSVSYTHLTLPTTPYV